MAQERMISMLKTEKPMVMTVKHSRMVFRSTFCLRSVTKMPQKHSARSAARKNAAPLLYGSPITLTKNRST